MAEEAAIVKKDTMTEDMFVKDVMNEKAFLDVMGDEKDLTKEVEVLKNVYKEQLEDLIRLRIDDEFYTWAMIAEPSDASNQEGKAKNDRAIKRKRKLVDVIRKQLKILKELRDKEVKK